MIRSPSSRLASDLAVTSLRSPPFLLLACCFFLTVASKGLRCFGVRMRPRLLRSSLWTTRRVLALAILVMYRSVPVLTRLPGTQADLHQRHGVLLDTASRTTSFNCAVFRQESPWRRNGWCRAQCLHHPDGRLTSLGVCPSARQASR